jgi:hypothetical protein
LFLIFSREWAERHGIPSEKSENLISDKAAKLYKVIEQLLAQIGC